MAFSRNESLAVQNQKLDEFVKQSDHYYQAFLRIIKENTNLQDEIKSLYTAKGRLLDMNGKLEDDPIDSFLVPTSHFSNAAVSSPTTHPYMAAMSQFNSLPDILKLHELIDGLQKQIYILISAEDEVRELKKILAGKNLQIPIIEKELKDAKERHEESLKKLQLEHSRNISEMARSFTEERDEMVNELKQQLEEERDKNRQLQGTLKNQEEKKQNEIICLKMEFETKMKLLQRQKNQSALSKQSCDQEIFRKKLSHMKEEYEKKISELEQSVSSLEWKLSEAPVLPLRERLQLFSNNNIIDKIKKKKHC
ncbi:Hypothetical predicted protein [Octopus vulgaris]|uniref:Uncharacterized protein n=1 Tax=Octopus vulgaris TaxID=6645 RepID=A0AA36BSR4_OCTVU|nr:Hypothetical predicted protein [Octopus vulgaris]